MNFVSRKYESGDEIYINKLYKTISEIDRSTAEYKWEWVDTWAGKGSVWLLFDQEREENDQLICQYSLIPVPISYFGTSFLAGKTENCMSHPEYRGKRIYFPHEKKYFPETQKRFQMCFTTTGQGAPGRVRRKLGYIALDYWVEYFYFLDIKETEEYIWKKYFSKLKKIPKIFSNFCSKIALSYFTWNLPEKDIRKGEIKLFKYPSSPVKEIELMWNRNKQEYGITVNRIDSFIDWRINKNPYNNHSYLTLFKEEKMIGYIIFYKSEQNIFHIVDILAERKKNSIFSRLINELKILSKEENVSGILCSTLKGNEILKKVFQKNNFLRKDSSKFQNIFSIKKTEDRPFHIFTSSAVVNPQKASIPSNWYITDLVKEGR